jgi:hypothetical protein
MKKHRITTIILASVILLIFGSCDVINDFIAQHTIDIPLIQIYNSNHEKTNKLQPNDTLYVEVQGLKALGYYTIQVLDPTPEQNEITMLSAQADENGVIAPTPLWYDIGFKKETLEGRVVAKLPTNTELGIRAFNIRVVSQAEEEPRSLALTDFKLPFWVVFKTDISRPQPIVMASKKDNTSGALYLENTYDVGDQLWIQVANLKTLLESDNPETTKMTVYLSPFDAGFYNSGYAIVGNYVAKQEFTVKELRDGVQFTANSTTWSGLGNWATVPDGAKGRAFSVFVDVDNNGIFDILKEGTRDFYLDGVDSNGVAGFIVRKPDPEPAVAFIPGNIASGGVTWGHFWFENWPDHDYRDQFYVDGWDTKYGYDWQFGGYGVKALWNPYVDKDIDQDPNNSNTLYYGKYVYLYIVEATTLKLDGSANLVPASGTQRLYMPVQYACNNGANLQTIWRAPMIEGHYCIVVDIDMDGKVSKGDLVDILGKDEQVRKVKINNVDYEAGFSVVPR